MSRISSFFISPIQEYKLSNSFSARLQLCRTNERISEFSKPAPKVFHVFTEKFSPNSPNSCIQLDFCIFWLIPEKSLLVKTKVSALTLTSFLIFVFLIPNFSLSEFWNSRLQIFKLLKDKLLSILGIADNCSKVISSKQASISSLFKLFENYLSSIAGITGTFSFLQKDL